MTTAPTAAPDGDTEGTDNAAASADWFAPKKRAILAPFGTGTVDQLELAALHARFYMLRLVGLAGKVVIIDEVHAYDTYMSRILERALHWLGLLGSSVIVLSATLPSKRRQALLRAFADGAQSRLMAQSVPAVSGTPTRRSLPPLRNGAGLSAPAAVAVPLSMWAGA